MMKIDPNGNTIERESDTLYKGRAVCCKIKVNGLELWLKGKRDSVFISWYDLYRYVSQGPLTIPARRVSDRELNRLQTILGTNTNDEEAGLVRAGRVVKGAS